MVYFIIAILWHTKIAILVRLLSYGIPYTMELHGFSYHIPKALENAAKNPPYELSSCFSAVLFVILVPKSGYTLKEQTEQIDKVNIVFLIIIPYTLESKTKCTKGKRGNACNFIKKEGNQYILGKSKTTLHKILVTFNTRLQKLHLLSKNLNEKCNNRVICKEIFLGF